MRELLYISDAKLERFVNDRRVVPPNLILDAQVSIANLLNIKIANSKGPAAWSSARIMKKVEKVVSHIESSSEPALWWNSEEVRIGRWIQFDTKLSFAITENLFLAWCSGPDEPFALSGYVDALPDTVLILHGSAEHVVGSAEFRERQAKAQPRSFRIGGASSGSEAPFIYFVQNELEPFLKQDMERRSLTERLRRKLRPRNRDPLGRAYGKLVELSERFELDTLSGFARVTGLFDIDVENWEDGRGVSKRRLILASPLYVERVVSGPTRY